MAHQNDNPAVIEDYLLEHGVLALPFPMEGTHELLMAADIDVLPWKPIKLVAMQAGLNGKFFGQLPGNDGSELQQLLGTVTSTDLIDFIGVRKMKIEQSGNFAAKGMALAKLEGRGRDSMEEAHRSPT
jgi:hypothetical protein